MNEKTYNVYVIKIGYEPELIKTTHPEDLYAIIAKEKESSVVITMVGRIVTNIEVNRKNKDNMKDTISKIMHHAANIRG